MEFDTAILKLRLFLNKREKCNGKYLKWKILHVYSIHIFTFSMNTNCYVKKILSLNVNKNEGYCWSQINLISEYQGMECPPQNQYVLGFSNAHMIIPEQFRLSIGDWSYIDNSKYKSDANESTLSSSYMKDSMIDVWTGIARI